MTEELVAIPKSEYEELLECMRRLEQMIQERIDMLYAQIGDMKYQLQVNDVTTAIHTGCQSKMQERREQ